MIKIKLQGHSYEYDIKEMLKQYFHKENIQVVKECNSLDSQDIMIENGIKMQDNKNLFYTSIQKNSKEISKSEIQLEVPSFKNPKEKEKWKKRQLKMVLYKAMEKRFHRSLPWGILTGIRPTKIVHNLLDEGKSQREIRDILKSQYILSDQKIELLTNVVKNERNIIYPIKEDTTSIYIGIPFCPSRCIYCSFLSTVLQNDRKIFKEYLKALYYEIAELGKYVKRHHLKIQSIYIGGGTPTVLQAGELDQLLTIVNQSFKINDVEEYTLEAGRPDTIDREKLEISLGHGINRISINPQTMNTKTLQNIGRSHSPEDIKGTYYLARKVGFSFINMDLILGLPGEDTEDVKETLKQIGDLEPENITIHTMSIKKGSKLKEEIKNIDLGQEERVIQMLEETQIFAKGKGYLPYYLYRQKNMMGNLENVGYCKPNYRSIYNIQMMAEKQTIIGLGAGSVTKVMFLKEDRLERMPNVKNVEQYTQRIEEMVNRKLSLLDSLYDV